MARTQKKDPRRGARGETFAEFQKRKRRERGQGVDDRDILGFNEHYLGGMNRREIKLPSWARSPEFTKGHRYRVGDKVLEAKARYAVGPNQSVDPQAWAKVVGRSPEQIRDVQIYMVQAGILGPRKFTPGAADDGTKKAFARLLTEANHAGMRWGDYLSARAQLAAEEGFGPPGSGGSERAPLVLELPNAENIKASVALQAPELLGSRAAAGDPQHYADTAIAEETKRQTDAYNMGDDSGGAVTDAIDPKAQMIREHPIQYGVAQMGPAAQQILAELEAGGGGASNFA